MVDYTNIPRDSRRVPLQTRVQFKFDRFSGFISEYSANISPGGMFLRTRTPRPAGTVLDLEFRLGDGFELIKGRGEVIWARAEDEGAARPAGMGIRFLNLSQGSKELIYRIVDEHVLQGGTPFDVTQRPPDPIPAPAETETDAPPPFPELAERPLAPGPREPEPVPDAAAWLPALAEPARDLPPAAEPFPELLAPEPPAPAPAGPPPIFTTTFGSASVQRPPRRILPWALLAVVLVLAAGAFLFGERLLEWTGLGGGQKAARPAPAPPGRPPARESRPAAATGVPAAPPAPSTAPPPSSTPAPAAPAPVAAAAPDTGPPLTVLERVTWERAGGGTDVVLWGNGSIPPEVYKQARLEGNPPRELIRLAGVRSPNPESRVAVGTPEVLQVRLGFHPEAGKGELHVVLDLAHPAAAVTGVEQEPHKLRIHVRRR